jgi:hypothetical protein
MTRFFMPPPEPVTRCGAASGRIFFSLPGGAAFQPRPPARKSARDAPCRSPGALPASPSTPRPHNGRTSFFHTKNAKGSHAKNAKAFHPSKPLRSLRHPLCVLCVGKVCPGNSLAHAPEEPIPPARRTRRSRRPTFVDALLACPKLDEGESLDISRKLIAGYLPR